MWREGAAATTCGHRRLPLRALAAAAAPAAAAAADLAAEASDVCFALQAGRVW